MCLLPLEEGMDEWTRRLRTALARVARMVRRSTVAARGDVRRLIQRRELTSCCGIALGICNGMKHFVTAGELRFILQCRKKTCPRTFKDSLGSVAQTGSSMAVAARDQMANGAVTQVNPSSFHYNSPKVAASPPHSRNAGSLGSQRGW